MEVEELSGTGTSGRGQMPRTRCGKTHEVKPLAKPSGELSCSHDAMGVRKLLGRPEAGAPFYST